MITHDDVRKIAALAKLYVEESKLDALTEDMSDIIDFANEISSADVSGLTDDAGYEGGVLREDEVKASFAQEDILKNASIAENGYFAVRGNVNE